MMEKLLEIIHKEGIHIKYADLRPVGDIQGLYIIHPKIGPMILLDRSLLFRPRPQRCVTVHELGHHFFPPRSGIAAFHRSSLFSESNKEIIIHQDDNKAIRWSTNQLMPTEAFWKAIRAGYDTVPLIAEFFDVCEWFVRAKIGFIRVEERRKAKVERYHQETPIPPRGGFAV